MAQKPSGIHAQDLRSSAGQRARRRQCSKECRMRTRSALLCFMVAVAATVALVAQPATAASGHRGGEDGEGFTVSGDTATFPLRAGRTLDGKPFSFIVVEASDSHAADAFGVRVV